MYPHRIRLRGPWEAEPLDPPRLVRKVTMPARFGECDFGDCRRVRFTRRFGRPRRLDEHERVWLIGEGLTGHAEFVLNGEVLGQHDGTNGAFAFHVTRLIGERNELAIEITAESSEGGIWGDVALEIRCEAFLNNVRMEMINDGRLRVSGAVEGNTDGPLDLYVLADDHTIGYKQTKSVGTFEIVTDPLTDSPRELRAELVNGSVVWYVAELPSR
jgi:hypothetical protein